MTIFFTDLDRTLIYSADALGLGAQDHDTQLTCVETYRGRPASFVTDVAADGIRRLLGAKRLVPVTTRSIEQYRRVRLPGPSPSLALVANGGRLLRDGVVDEDFSRATASILAGSTPLEVMLAHLTSVASPHFVVNVRPVERLFCYAVVDTDGVPSTWLGELADYAAGVGWQVSDQGRKIYALPSGLSKGEAARRVAADAGIGRFVAAGDTNVDEALLVEAAASIVPRHSALAPRAARIGSAVTVRSGALAGEEIVGWAEQRLREPHVPAHC